MLHRQVPLNRARRNPGNPPGSFDRHSFDRDYFVFDLSPAKNYLRPSSKQALVFSADMKLPGQGIP